MLITLLLAQNFNTISPHAEARAVVKLALSLPLSACTRSLRLVRHAARSLSFALSARSEFVLIECCSGN